MMILKTSRSNLSSNDQLSLDLPFAETKSLIARVGPTPTFTRGSGATYIGSDGLIHGVDTSTTSNTIGTGSRTFTLAATAGQDQFWRAGDAVEASNGANFMTGTVTSYTAATQVLVCNMTSIGGSGTFTSWRIGYRGPRFDHTSAGVCRGLLIEESRTNICLQSENFGTTWVNTNTTISSNTETSPDGNTTADTATVNNAGTNFLAQQVTVAASTQYTFSFYTKRGSATNATYSVYNNNANNDIVSATSYFSQTSLSAWVRVSFQFTTPVGCTSIFIYVLRNTGSTGSMHFWGAQLEAGSFPTSYIPTTTASVVRSADVCSISGANFNSIWNATEGTMLSIGDSFGSALTFYSYLTAQGSPSTSNVFMANFGATAVVIQKDTPQAFKSEATIPDATLKKLAYSYTSGSTSSSAINGAIPTPSTNNSTASVASASSFDIGFLSTGRLNGHIAAIRYYRKRLPNAKLVTLTT